MRVHGDPGMYRYYGCRCDECRAAAAAQTLKRRRLNRIEAGPTAAEALAIAGEPGEEWREIAAWPGYEVSSLGRVRSTKFNFPRIISMAPSRGGYLRVRLWSGNRARQVLVAGLVAEAFLGPRPDGQEVRHYNDDKSNNTVANLLYGTRSQNIYDAVRNGTQAQVAKTHCPHGHPYDAANTRIRREGWRTCRACQNARQREARARAAR